MTYDIGTRDLCSLLNISRPTITGWIKQGLPHIVEGRKYLFDEAVARQWVIENCKGKEGKPGYLRKLAAQASREKRNNQETINEEPKGSENMLTALARAKLEKEQLQGEKLKLQVEELKKQYVHVDDVRRERLQRIQAVKAGLLALPGKYSNKWAGIRDARVLHKQFEEAVYQILAGFSK